MTKVLIADDHDVVREGIVSIVSSTADMYVADEASDGFQVLELTNQNKYDIILLDLNLPCLSGMEVLKKLHAMNPNLAVLIISMYDEKQIAKRALAAGAAGYLTKETAAEHLTDAIRKISIGGRYISPEIAAKIKQKEYPAYGINRT